MEQCPVKALRLCKPILRLVPLLALAALCPPESVHGREIAILKSADIAVYNQAVAGFKAAAMANTTFSEYNLQGNFERGRKLARKLRASNAALVLAVGLKAALAARLEILDTPVVFCMVLDPAKYDLKAPNMRGITLEIPLTRQFSTIKSVLPRIKKVGVLFDASKTGELVEEGRGLAKRLGLELVEGRVRSEKDVPIMLRKLMARIDALWLIPDSTVLTQDSLRFLLGTALDHNVPVIGFSSEFVRSGVLVGLSVSYQGVGQQAAQLASRILAGQASLAAAAVPPERVHISLNLKTARFLGITIPAQVVRSADKLYGGGS